MSEKASTLAKQLLTNLIDQFIILENDLEQVKKELELYKTDKTKETVAPKKEVAKAKIEEKKIEEKVEVKEVIPEPKEEQIIQLTSQEKHEEEEEGVPIEQKPATDNRRLF